MKNILVFSNGEKIGDGIIKLPFIIEIKKRFPSSKLHWITDKGTTVYNNRLKNIAQQYIDIIYEQSNLKYFFWNKISSKFEFEKMKFDYIIDTQKSLIRTLSIKRIKCNFFISATAAGFFSDIPINRKYYENDYYVNGLFYLLNLIKPENKRYQNTIDYKIPVNLYNQLKNIFDKKYKYIGYALGAGENDKIWDIKKFFEVIQYFEKKDYKTVLFLGPNDQGIKELTKKNIQNAIYPEEIIKDFSGPEIVMSSTKFLTAALSNDSGVSHMLSTNNCFLIKLFGPKNPDKFTPDLDNIKTISSKNYDSLNINKIPVNKVIQEIEIGIKSRE
ncbi:MAG: hypothetical protein CFH19_01235 [Alphaproteobacteria bacterium MarineAlpha5_Bin9]|nr:MAG: hypothetical protein CFH19_01235 [Alphaproteobacteria bacterium MarineAlpha5_Bin9]|tara:strand:+ start:4196 stop:5185 length:990 start_codon:yes stop_codon:yes gene_type:complete